jgi:Ankyrin repeats (many copies)
LEVVQYLVETGRANVNARAKNGDTPLHRATLTTRLAVTQYLVETCGANVNMVNKSGQSLDRSWYFWPRFVHENMDDFWKWAPMGGETRVENQHSLFEATYPARTYQKQDFMECVNVTHATYMLHQTYVFDLLFVVV